MCRTTLANFTKIQVSLNLLTVVDSSWTGSSQLCCQFFPLDCTGERSRSACKLLSAVSIDKMNHITCQCTFTPEPPGPLYHPESAYQRLKPSPQIPLEALLPVAAHPAYPKTLFPFHYPDQSEDSALLFPVSDMEKRGTTLANTVST